MTPEETNRRNLRARQLEESSMSRAALCAILAQREGELALIKSQAEDMHEFVLAQINEDLRGQVANLELANEEARKTIDRQAETISGLDPQYDHGGPG